MIYADRIKKALILSALAFILVFSAGCGLAADASEPVPQEIPTAAPTSEPTPAVSPYEGMLVINELMVKNHATLRDEEGDFSTG